MVQKGSGQGVARALNESHVDIAVVDGKGDDVFVKVAGEVVLTDRMSLSTLHTEIGEYLEGDR